MGTNNGRNSEMSPKFIIYDEKRLWHEAEDREDAEKALLFLMDCKTSPDTLIITVVTRGRET